MGLQVEAKSLPVENSEDPLKSENEGSEEKTKKKKGFKARQVIKITAMLTNILKTLVCGVIYNS